MNCKAALRAERHRTAQKHGLGEMFEAAALRRRLQAKEPTGSFFGFHRIDKLRNNRALALYFHSRLTMSAGDNQR